MKFETIYDQKEKMIKFLDKLKKELSQPELVENSMIECFLDVDRTIKIGNHKLMSKTIKITFQYEEDLK